MAELTIDSSMKEQDKLFRDPLPNIGAFRFDDSVASVFPDMLRRSIPGYQAIISQSGLLASRFAQPNTNLYDLGCSLGATALSMKSALLSPTGTSENPHQSNSRHSNVIHGVDNSEAMLKRAEAAVAEYDAARLTKATENSNSGTATDVPIRFHCQDIQSCTLENASVVAMNFTLQFIPPEDRSNMMQRIARGLRPGGVLILSEKVTFSDPVLSELHIDMYHEFKRANGYSELEISQKRTALENVLIPDTLETHNNRLAEAGFSSSSVWFQCFNFASLIAIK